MSPIRQQCRCSVTPASERAAADFPSGRALRSFTAVLTPNQCRAILRIRRRAALLEDSRELRDGRRLKEGVKWNPRFQFAGDAGNDSSGEQRMAAEIEEVVVNSDAF